MKRRHSQLADILELHRQDKPYHLCLNGNAVERNENVLRMLQLRRTLSPSLAMDPEQHGRVAHLMEQLTPVPVHSVEKLNRALSDPLLVELLPTLLKILNSQ